jgi:acid phosphatase family membrane protein YuiD
MEWLSKYLIAIVAAWLIANLVKVIIYFIQNKEISQQPIFTTGGMPSTHTAPVAALTTIISLVDGVQSVAFAIVFVLAIITMTDAVKVRRAVGEQGEAITKLLSKNQPKPYFARGHKLTEVVVGAMIGIVVGITIYFMM